MAAKMFGVFPWADVYQYQRGWYYAADAVAWYATRRGAERAAERFGVDATNVNGYVARGPEYYRTGEKRFDYLKNPRPQLLLGISYSITSEQSARHGDEAEHGWIDEMAPASFREVIDTLGRHRDWDMITVHGGRLTAYPLDVQTDYRTGNETSRYVHVAGDPRDLARIMKLLPK